MNQGFPFLLSLLCRLKEAGIEHSLEHQDQSILVLAHTDRQRWEIQIPENSDVSVTIFEKDPHIHGSDKLEELFRNLGPRESIE